MSQKLYPIQWSMFPITKYLIGECTMEKIYESGFGFTKLLGRPLLPDITWGHLCTQRLSQMPTW